MIEVALRGPDERILADVLEAFTDEASDWVSAIYRAYTLELLEIEATEGSVSASPAQSIVLATLLGFLLGLGVVFAESKARERRGLNEPMYERAEAPVSYVTVKGSRRLDYSDLAFISPLFRK